MAEKGKIILNGQSASGKILDQAMHALSDSSILVEKGGFLIKATLTDTVTWIDIVPCVINGNRTYHYDMQLEVETEFTLVGSVNANGIITLFFNPKQAPLSDHAVMEYGLAYTRLSQLLKDAGYTGEGILDWSTQKLLEESGIRKPPPTSILDF